jgi:hypothetical protein
MCARVYNWTFPVVIAALELTLTAQGPRPALAATMQPAAAALPSGPVDQRNGIRVLVAKLNVRAHPTRRSAVIAHLQRGDRFESDERRGNWYRIRLADGRKGWVDHGVGKTNTNFSVDANPAPAGAGPKGEVPTVAAANQETPPAAEGLPDDHVILQRPMGKPLEPVVPEIDPRQVPPPAPFLPRESVPVRDRWRLVDQLGIVNQRWFDPYDPNALKGDRPIEGTADWFFELMAISDTLLEWRRLPTSVGAQSTQSAQENDQFGNGRQSEFQQNLIVSLSWIKGDTTFRPPDFQARLVPVINFNRTVAAEVGTVNINPTQGTTRNDNIVALQEAFVDVRLRDVSERFDFDSIRVGIQPFTSDFRGLVYLDEPLGVRLFGTRDNNQWQYNLAWFRRLEKDTNSGLNDVSKPLRHDDIFLFNLYKQDFWVPGFTLQGTVIYNDNRETATFLDNNGFQVRPAIFGDARPRPYHVTYLGLNGDGHLGSWNTTASAYYVFGRDSHNQLSQQGADISAFYGVAEVSRDFDWIRVRATGAFASGDQNPFHGKETGFDAILENPQIAGADTSYWIRQAIPLIGGGGVALSVRNGLLASLRSSGDQGQSNFVNPGVGLIGIGADFDVTPRYRVIGNLNELWFANTTVLSVLRNQGNIDRNIGTDLSAALQYRPLFTQNIVLNTSAAVLLPGKGMRQLFDVEGGKAQYSILFNLVLTF